MSQESFKVSGHVTVEAVYRDGRRELLSEGHNLVVNSGLDILCELLAQNLTAVPPDLSPAKNKLCAVWLGGRTTGSGDTSATAAPAPGDTALKGALVAKLPVTTVDRFSTPTSRGVSFKATLDFDDGNGKDIQEVMLVSLGNGVSSETADGRPFSRRLVGTIEKSEALSLDFTWRISFRPEEE